MKNYKIKKPKNQNRTKKNRNGRHKKTGIDSETHSFTYSGILQNYKTGNNNTYAKILTKCINTIKNKNFFKKALTMHYEIRTF